VKASESIAETYKSSIARRINRTPQTMASDQAQPTGRVAPAPVVPEVPAIILHVISPSSQVVQRYTFNDLPLSTTVWEMKARLSATVPGQPDPQTQRLIYKGRVLVNSEVLKNIVDPLAVCCRPLASYDGLTNNFWLDSRALNAPYATSEPNLGPDSYYY
jgi:hypothetical protein